MRLFLTFCHATFQDASAYRLESLLWFVIESIPILIMTSLWKSLEISGHISPAQAGNLILYYVLSLLIARLASTHFEEWFSLEIKDGKINSRLVKPFAFKTYLLADSTIYRLMGTFYTLPIFVLLAPLYLPALTENFSPVKTFLFFFLILVSFFQKFFISWLIGISAFWFDQTYFLTHLKWLLEGLMGGGWLPMTFFPLWWQTVSRFTPFYYWYFFPIQVYITPMPNSEIIEGIFISLVWLTILIWFGRVIWQSGLKRHSAVSG